ncbi:ArnT family glycosyltransferase [Thalassotalea sp. PS06]|uniref:ArnT family glycosyltransferase n=1 Tax=Thalassotalea sp. PS06 TaxID=2594005 RepID=UPI00116391D3|nr:glycosyltransferase family 39 protein [Thalassotalea sp. PS06]QDO99894.1 hypothetical protein FNC98_00125 [Thalassotalea sp. PS06]
MESSYMATLGLRKRLFFLIGILIAIIAIVALYIPGMDTIWLYHEETRRALVAREMAQNGTWLTPTINQQAYWAKPPLFNWTIILTSSFTGGEINELSARLPSLLFTFAGIISLFLFTRRYLSLRVQVWLMLMVLFTPELARKATSAELDTVFMVLVNLSLFTWFYYWQKQQSKTAWVVSMTCLGLAYLCKREAALLCYFLTIFGFLTYCRLWPKVNKTVLLSTLLIPIIFAALWWLPMLVKFGLQSSVELNQAEMAARQNKGSTIEYLLGVIKYPFEVWLALLPASLLLPVLLAKSLRMRLKENYGDLYLFCLVGIVLNLLPVMLIGDSNVRYFMPMFILALLLSAMIIDLWINDQLKAGNWLARYQKNLGKSIPMVFYSLLIVACAVVMVMAPVSWQSNIGLLVILSISVYLAVRQWQLPKADKAIEQGKSFLQFSIILVLLVRLFDLSYSLPYRDKSLHEYRDIEGSLQQIKAIKEKVVVNSPTATDIRTTSVYGDHNLSHGIYFYDEERLVTPVDCKTFTTKQAAIWLFLLENGESLELGNGDVLLAQFPYTKKHRLHLVNTKDPEQYCR